MRAPAPFSGYRDASGTRWLLSGDEWQDTAAAASAAIEAPDRIPAEQLLKAGTRRLVFVLEPGDATLPETIVKAFPLQGLRTRLKHDKYAPSEARNLIEAAQRGVPVPELYGVGAHRERGLVRWNAVLMEKIEGRTFTEAMTGADEAARKICLTRTVGLFRRLFDAACNHIDLKPEALIFGEAASDDRILDFQYCRFGDEPNLATLMAQAGHFAHFWSQVGGKGTEVEAWFTALIEALNVSPERQDTARAVFQANCDRVPSIAERLRQ